MKRKDKFTVVSIIVTIVCILVSIIFFFLVPNKISIQWSAAEPSNIVSKTYIFIMPIVSAKYCYAAHESRLHQNDRCKRFALCLVLTVRFRSLAPWGKLFQLFI